MVCSAGTSNLRERLLDLLQLDVAALRDLPGAVERVFQFAEQLHHLVARSSGRNRASSSACGWGRSSSCRSGCTAGFRARAHLLCAGNANRWWPPAAGRSPARGGSTAGVRRLSCSRWWSCTSRKKLFLPEDVGIGVRQAPGVVVLVGEDGFGDVAAQAGRHADQALGVLRPAGPYRCAACNRSRRGRRWRPG